MSFLSNCGILAVLSQGGGGWYVPSHGEPAVHCPPPAPLGAPLPNMCALFLRRLTGLRITLLPASSLPLLFLGILQLPWCDLHVLVALTLSPCTLTFAGTNIPVCAVAQRPAAQITLFVPEP